MSTAAQGRDSGVTIGIDLGTAYSCVAVCQNGRVEIIPNEQGNRITPSYVTFNNNGRLIGDEAKNQTSINPRNTIFHTKRLIGRKFNDPDVQSDLKHWPFKVINDNGRPKIEVTYKNQTKVFTPEEISSMILIKMKNIAEIYLGKKVSSAVITVPASFNSSQRQSTKDAGTIAGLHVLRIINESSAAALAYGFDQENISKERNILVFDLGGGTFSVSIVSITEGIFEVKSTAGVAHLGGEDFHNRMVHHFVQELKRKYGKDLQSDECALQRLRIACEHAKLVLSSSSQASIEIDSLHEQIDFYSTITRDRFEQLNHDLFRLILAPVEKSLRDAKMDKSQIHEIVLVGGSTRIPKVQKLLQDFFNGKQLYKSINPDEAVAYGAAIEAAILTGDKSKKLEDILLFDVVSLPLGIEASDGTMAVVITRNTRLPEVQTRTFTTHKDNQLGCDIKVFEGEQLMAKNNYMLASFQFFPIHPAPQGQPKIEVTFDIDVNGILKVSAVEKTFGKAKKMTVTTDSGYLSKDELKRMINEAQIEQDWIEANNSLQSYCLHIKSTIDDENFTTTIDDYDKKKMIYVAEKTLVWSEINQFVNKEELEDKLKEIKKMCSSLTMEVQPVTSRFYNACQDNNSSLVKHYLEIMSTEQINQIESNGSSALHAAAFYGHEEVVQILLKKGACCSKKNKYNCTPLEEAKTDKIKQMIRRRMNKTRFVSDSITWTLATNDADVQAHRYFKFMELFVRPPELDKLISYIKTNYLETDLKDIDDFHTIKEYFDMAINENDPIYLLKAYTAETGFYPKLNLHIAQLTSENLTDKYIVGRTLYVAIIARHPKLETLSYTGITYRSMIITSNDLEQCKIDTRILIKTFFSTSKQMNIVLRFLHNNVDIDDRLSVICEYEILNQRTALDIQYISLFEGEQEVLILPYSIFKIVDIKIDENNSPQVEIKLKECKLK
ncbi:unnamed protein product [Adineta steineri]|uniref:Uncharacterized protein n=1 Tax=Adineta steineri TaxID=433720 RepID=A0A814IN73_9BILA|nr:unnamed protein product [Adineta steineri]